MWTFWYCCAIVSCIPYHCCFVLLCLTFKSRLPLPKFGSPGVLYPVLSAILLRSTEYYWAIFELYSVYWELEISLLFFHTEINIRQLIPKIQSQVPIAASFTRKRKNLILDGFPKTTLCALWVRYSNVYFSGLPHSHLGYFTQNPKNNDYSPFHSSVYMFEFKPV